jgi:alkanesulfonate monooxygenase SsuD/methylene tetrahydromethanopterin reductase-like flavin-dependent oxidoreductase (luciferase family)
VTLEFGVFDPTAIIDAEDPMVTAQDYEDHLGDAQLAERLDYTYFFFIEHQNAGFPCISSPTVYLAALARATSRIRIGPMIFMLPLHHPIRLAEDTAVIDLLSRGRLDVGIGSGTRGPEFAPWHVDFNGRREHMHEVMEIVIKSWTERKFSHEGKHWSFTNVEPQPRPYQRPHPPVWVGAHSPASYEYAAEHGYNVSQIFESEKATAEKFEYFRTYWRKLGNVDAAPKAALVRHVHVAETDELALQEAERYMLNGIQGQASVGRLQRLADDAPPDVRELARIYYQTSQSAQFWFDEGLAFVGSPASVVAGIRAQQQRVGYDVLLTNHQFAEMPRELYLKSMRLFGEHVIPAFSTAVSSRR